MPDTILKPSATPATIAIPAVSETTSPEAITATIAIPAVSETTSPEAADLGPTTLLEYFSPVKPWERDWHPVQEKLVKLLLKFNVHAFAVEHYCMTI